MPRLRGRFSRMFDREGGGKGTAKGSKAGRQEGSCHWTLYKAAGHDQQVLTGWRFVAAVTGLIAAIALSIHLLFDLVERRRRRRRQRRLIAGQEGVND